MWAMTESCTSMTETVNPYWDEVRSLRMAFEYELCAECGGDWDDHVISPDPFGHAHAWCKGQHDEF